MQRTILSSPSTDEVTMTGTSRNCGSALSCSSTAKPSSSGISMSSSSRSNASLRNLSSARRPFSASAQRCPSSSTLRDNNKRLTLLSSTISRRELSSAIEESLQFRSGAQVFRFQRRQSGRVADCFCVLCFKLKLARQRSQFHRAEGVAVGLYRMRGAAEAFGVAVRACVAQLGQHAGALFDKRVHKLGHEL